MRHQIAIIIIALSILSQQVHAVSPFTLVTLSSKPATIATFAFAPEPEHAQLAITVESPNGIASFRLSPGEGRRFSSDLRSAASAPIRFPISWAVASQSFIVSRLNDVEGIIFLSAVNVDDKLFSDEYTLASAFLIAPLAQMDGLAQSIDLALQELWMSM